MADYEVRIEPGQGMSLSGPNGCKIRPTWTGKIVYVDDDGTETTAYQGGAAYFQEHDRNKRRTRAKLNIMLGRLRAHLRKHGTRWEIEQHQQRIEAAEQKLLKREARQRLTDAAPDLLAALKGLLDSIDHGLLVPVAGGGGSLENCRIAARDAYAKAMTPATYHCADCDATGPGKIKDGRHRACAECGSRKIDIVA